MKRAHRRWHRRTWLLLAPAIGLLLLLALVARGAWPVNTDDWPDFLTPAPATNAAVPG